MSLGLKKTDRIIIILLHMDIAVLTHMFVSLVCNITHSKLVGLSQIRENIILPGYVISLLHLLPLGNGLEG